MKKRAIIGVDEAGRGPLAGPVAVGAVLFTPQFDMKLLKGVRDSKLHTELQREEWFVQLKEWHDAGLVRYAVALASAKTIDEKGITRAVRSAVARAVRRLAPDPTHIYVQLDGLLKAPAEYEQETVIHGDALLPAISLASIAAKVTRDRLMCRMAKKFPEYGFEQHKGYGTKAHREAIEECGLCEIHRRTFCKNGN
ncbi:MAG TPA: ribonuclease HII [Candidatus Paceibacterota bacterium]